MPGAGKPGPSPTFLESLVPLLHASFHEPLNAVAQIWTLPGQVVVSAVLVGAAAVSLRGRGRSEAAAGWIAAWALATAIEVVCKHALTRPALYRDGLRALAFDDSWPSGHTLRCAIVAGALATAWPRLRPALALWLAVALALLVAAGFHTPTDVLGGLLLALPLAIGVRELERSGRLSK